MDDATASGHPFDVAFLQPASGIFHRAVEHEGHGFKSGMGMRLAKASTERDVVVGHEKEWIGRTQITGCDDQGGLVPVAIEAWAECGCCGDTINRSVEHGASPCCRSVRVRSCSDAALTVLPMIRDLHALDLVSHSGTPHCSIRNPGMGGWSTIVAQCHVSSIPRARVRRCAASASFWK